MCTIIPQDKLMCGMFNMVLLKENIFKEDMKNFFG